jgi:hypothetical protein
MDNKQKKFHRLPVSIAFASLALLLGWGSYHIWCAMQTADAVQKDAVKEAEKEADSLNEKKAQDLKKETLESVKQQDTAWKIKHQKPKQQPQTQPSNQGQHHKK